MKSQILISIILTVIFLSSCKQEQIATDNYRLEVETLVSTVTNGSEIILNSDKVFYYDQTGRLTGTGDHTTISEHYEYTGEDTLVYYGLNDTSIYLLNENKFPIMRFHSGNGGTQTDYYQDTTWYTYENNKLIHVEMHELFSGFGINSYNKSETFFNYDFGDNLIADSTFDLITGTIISKSYYTYLQDDAHADQNYFNQINQFPYTGKMANYLLDSKTVTKIEDWGTTQWDYHFSYTLNVNGLPSEKTVNTTITETGGVFGTPILTNRFSYTWELI